MKASTIKLALAAAANRGKLLALFLTTMWTAAAVADGSSPWFFRAPNFTCEVAWFEKGEVKGGRVAEYFKYHPIPKSSAYQEITWLKRPPKNLVNTRAIEVNTPDVQIKVNSDRSDLISTRTIDGVRYILIRAENGVEVSGMNVNIAVEE